MRQNQVRQEEREPLRRQDTVAAVKRGIDGHFFVGSVTLRTLVLRRQYWWWKLVSKGRGKDSSCWHIF